MLEYLRARGDPYVIAPDHVCQEITQKPPTHRTARDLRMQDQCGNTTPRMCRLELVQPQRQDRIPAEDWTRIQVLNGLQ